MWGAVGRWPSSHTPGSLSVPLKGPFFVPTRQWQLQDPHRCPPWAVWLPGDAGVIMAGCVPPFKKKTHTGNYHGSCSFHNHGFASARQGLKRD